MNKLQTYLERHTLQYRVLRYGAAVVFLISFFLFIGWAMNEKEFELHNSVRLFKSTSTDVYENALSAPYALPTKLSIPSAQIEAPFEGALGLDGYGAVHVPKGYESVGWYEHGPVPGSIGPSVILGHVDSKEGPAVFFYLGQVKEGDEVAIERNDGSRVIYEITELERIEQGVFPTERVYGSIPYAGLRLITCSGTYDREEKRYTHNLIVYARLKAVE